MLARRSWEQTASSASWAPLRAVRPSHPPSCAGRHRLLRSAWRCWPRQRLFWAAPALQNSPKYRRAELCWCGCQVLLQGRAGRSSQPCLMGSVPPVPVGTLGWSSWSLKASLLSSLCLLWSLELRDHQPPEHRGRCVDDVSRVSFLFFFCWEGGSANYKPLSRGQWV